MVQADLLLQLDPDSIESVFGKDVAAELDRELGLDAGTAGRVLQALLRRLGGTNDRTYPPHS